jgi:hypothetical protein
VRAFLARSPAGDVIAVRTAIAGVRVAIQDEQKERGTERDRHVKSVEEVVMQLAVLLPGLLHGRAFRMAGTSSGMKRLMIP